MPFRWMRPADFPFITYYERKPGEHLAYAVKHRDFWAGIVHQEAPGRGMARMEFPTLEEAERWVEQTVAELIPSDPSDGPPLPRKLKVRWPKWPRR